MTSCLITVARYMTLRSMSDLVFQEAIVASLMNRGLTVEEAEYQFNCETIFNKYVNEHMDSACIISALCQIISFGTV